MKHDPVLARTTLPASREEGRRYPHTFIVSGGLHYIKGNSQPHFSLTCTEHRQGFPNQEESGGCGTDRILHLFPEFADMAALHLSDLDGVPMHAESIGWYNLAGALGGFGEKHHGGNSKQNFPLPAARIDPAKPWQTTEYRLPTCEECLQSFARHCRITLEDAKQIRGEVDPLNWRQRYATISDANARILAITVARIGKFTSAEAEHARAERLAKQRINAASDENPSYLIQCHNRWHDIYLAMRPRWKQEAGACIAQHGLTLYGDPWTGDRPPGLRLPNEAMPRTCHDLLPGDSASASPPASPVELTYVDAWGITSTATEVDRNPNMDDTGRDMTHWRVTLRRGRAKMTVYYSMGSAHVGHEPTAQEVIDCIAQDGAYLDGTFENWARDLGLDPDSRAAHRTYMVCKRQTERLQKFLGDEHYAELMGEE